MKNHNQQKQPTNLTYARRIGTAAVIGLVGGEIAIHAATPPTDLPTKAAETERAHEGTMPISLVKKSVEQQKVDNAISAAIEGSSLPQAETSVSPASTGEQGSDVTLAPSSAAESGTATPVPPSPEGGVGPDSPTQPAGPSGGIPSGN